MCGKTCDFEGQYVVFATPVSQKRRHRPIYFILDSLSAPMNVPYTKFSGNSMKKFNPNASTLIKQLLYKATLVLSTGKQNVLS